VKEEKNQGDKNIDQVFLLVKKSEKKRRRKNQWSVFQFENSVSFTKIIIIISITGQVFLLSIRNVTKLLKS